MAFRKQKLCITDSYISCEVLCPSMHFTSVSVSVMTRSKASIIDLLIDLHNLLPPSVSFPYQKFSRFLDAEKAELSS